MLKTLFFAFSVLAFSLPVRQAGVFHFPMPVFAQSCQLKFQGDADCNGSIDFVDYDYYRRIVLLDSSVSPNISADFNGDGETGVSDGAILIGTLGFSSSPTGQPTGVPTAEPTMEPTNSQQPVSGIWISPQEIMALQTSGTAWDGVVSVANSNGTPDLSTYNGLAHSQMVYAAALVCVRTGQSQYCDKAHQALNDIMSTEIPALPQSNGGRDDGSLAIARQFPRYVLAADLLGISNLGPDYKGYRNFVDYMLHTKFTFRVGDGGQTFSDGHDSCASNGNAMAGAARIVSAAYLNDQTELNRAWLTFQRYTGNGSVGPNICINSSGQTWFYDSYNTTQHVGINPKGATCVGTNYPADGVLPADQGRGGNCPANSNQSPGYTQYPWEGLQGVYAQALILYRLGYKDASGKNPFQINDSALLRAVQYQWYLQQKFGGSWYDSNRAAWVKHLANVFYGFKPIQYDSSDGGRNMSHSQWTNQ